MTRQDELDGRAEHHEGQEAEDWHGWAWRVFEELTAATDGVDDEPPETDPLAPCGCPELDRCEAADDVPVCCRCFAGPGPYIAGDLCEECAAVRDVHPPGVAPVSP